MKVPSNNSNSPFIGTFSQNTPKPVAAGIEMRAKYDFAVAYPDPDSLPLTELANGLREALKTEGRDLAIYPHPQGYPPLRQYVSEKLSKDRNIQVDPDEIILADGSSQPIHMFTELLVDPGDVVLTEDFVYAGTLGTLRRFGADIRGVTSDAEGMIPEALQEVLKSTISSGKRPKLIYTIPTFQNPQGWTMTLSRRKAVLRISQEFGVPILEDDCYVDLRFEGENITSIYSLDDSQNTLYVGSFSKVIAPGMRMGYMTGPSEVIARARAVKSGSGVNQFTALAVHRYATNSLADHVGEINNIFREKRDSMLAALGENFGSAASWSKPQGALYIWLKLRNSADVASAHQAALDADVGFHPGPRFAPDGVSGKNYARLCYGYNTPEEIHDGIARLAEVFYKQRLI